MTIETQIPDGLPWSDGEPVDILGVRFLRLNRQQAVSAIAGRIRRGATTAVCFPDMSTLNIAARQPSFRRLLQQRMTTLNDGAGLAWAARLRGRPFPDNLNGTDLCPALLAEVPDGTSVYLLGASEVVAARSREVLAQRFPRLRFVGAHHGYLDAELERDVVAQVHQLRPQIVMVGMGNPRQVELIDRHLDDPALAGTTWLAVGGQLDYYGGTLERAPNWMIRSRLEWLHLVLSQPHKARRYLLGIPLFIGRCLWAQLRGTHAVERARR